MLAAATHAWPDAQTWQRVLLLEDYNTRIVIAAVTLLGAAAGTIGCFALLRKRALVGDALSHATLPGIVIAYLVATAMGTDGKTLPVLLTGATITGVLGVVSILVLRRTTRLKEDTAMGIILSVFFGAGIALMGIVQKLPGGQAAGLESFITGKTATITSADAWLIGVAALIIAGSCLILFRLFSVLCFDADYSQTRGLPVVSLDIFLMALIVLVTVVGLQAVGLILVIALLVIPAAAARFWTDSIAGMVPIAALIGAVSAALGGIASALFADLPSGAMIVVTAATFFGLSMMIGPARGVLFRMARQIGLQRRIGRQNLLRAMFELRESGPATTSRATDNPADETSSLIRLDDVLKRRSWSAGELRWHIIRSQREGLVVALPTHELRFTRRGLIEARRLVRQHRLWELYLITHADIAPSHVDRDADAIEHVLSPEMIAELESLLDLKDNEPVVGSPHPIGE